MPSHKREIKTKKQEKTKQNKTTATPEQRQQNNNNNNKMSRYRNQKIDFGLKILEFRHYNMHLHLLNIMNLIFKPFKIYYNSIKPFVYACYGAYIFWMVGIIQPLTLIYIINIYEVYTYSLLKYILLCFLAKVIHK